MKQFMLSLCGIVVLALLVEIFCPAKRLKNIVYMAFSMSIIFVLISAVSNLINNNLGRDNTQFSTNISESLDLFSVEMVNYQQNLIKGALQREGIDVDEVNIEYEITNNNINYSKVVVCGAEKNEQEKIYAIIMSAISINKEQIDICE